MATLVGSTRPLLRPLLLPLLLPLLVRQPARDPRHVERPLDGRWRGRFALQSVASAKGSLEGGDVAAVEDGLHEEPVEKLDDQRALHLRTCHPTILPRRSALDSP
eukprot:1196014-Prorocentrum_minimum.AAC.5